MPDLLTDLTAPGAYPEPRPAAVTAVVTHISWVFLAGQTVWKVKRPVKLGFLDFSTLEARRHFCEEEVRLNARLAPGVYQGVVPVRLGPAGAWFGGEGPVVDHAVKMRRLPDSDNAENRLQAGRLTMAHLASLAARLARFYAEAPVTPAYGAIDLVAGNVEENLTALAALSPALVSPQMVAAVSGAQRRDLQRLGPRLAARVDGGKIREGHGDLRLEHVYFPDDGGTPLIIDCVEFDERYRASDVALDVAFFAMELEAAGQATRAEYFLYRFARETGDFDFYPLIDFYIGYRALVRAKIAGLLAGDPGTPPARAEGKRLEALHLLGMVQAGGAGRFHPGLVIAVGGLVGAGKSTIAETLARRLGLPVVSSDVTRKQQAGVPITARGDAALYTAAATARTYDELLRRADLVLDSGRGVILDGTFRSAAERARARALATSHRATFLFIEAVADEATLRARLRERGGRPSESDAGEAVLDRLLAELEPPHELPAHEVLAWSSRQDEENADALVRAVLAHS